VCTSALASNVAVRMLGNVGTSVVLAMSVACSGDTLLAQARPIVAGVRGREPAFVAAVGVSRHSVYVLSPPSLHAPASHFAACCMRWSLVV